MIRVLVALAALLWGGEVVAQDPAPSTGWLGISLEVEVTAVRNESGVERTSALTVERIFEGGPADRAGLRTGDRLTKLNGAPATPELFDRVGRRLAPGDPVSITVERGGEIVQLGLTADPRPATAELVPRTLQGRLDAAREIFVTRLEESLGRLRDGASPRFLARLAPVVEGAGARGLVPRMVVRTVEGDSLVVLHVDAGASRSPFDPAASGDPVIVRVGDVGFGAPPARGAAGHAAVDGPLSWRQEEDGHLVIRSDSAAVDVTLRPLAPYLYGADRMAGARFIPLSAGLQDYFGTDRGVVTAEVLPGTPAQRAGMRAGDVVMAVGATPVTSPEELRLALARMRGITPVTVVRRGRTLQLELGR